MTYSIFIEILQHLRSMKMTDRDLISSEIGEYITWLNWSQVLYNKEYSIFVNDLISLQEIVNDRTKSYKDICDYIADLISFSYLRADENEV